MHNLLNPEFTKRARAKQPRSNRVSDYHRNERKRLKSDILKLQNARKRRMVFTPTTENPRQKIDGLFRETITFGIAEIIRKRSKLGLSTHHKHLQRFTDRQIEACSAHAVVAVMRGQVR